VTTTRTVRALADDHVRQLADLDTAVATALGTHPGDDRVPDLSPAGHEARADLARATLGALPAAAVTDDDRRCGRLLRERLEAELTHHGSGEPLRAVRTIAGPHEAVRRLFELMPTTTADDWAVVARRMAAVPRAYDGYLASLAEAARRGLHPAPRRVAAVVAQLDAWLAADWFRTFVATAPDGAPHGDLARAADAATASAAHLRTQLATVVLPAAAGTPDAVGAERYRIGARLATGADLDLAEAYAWGWDEFRRLDEELRREARAVLPGADPITAMRHLDEHGPAVEGVEQVRAWLQEVMDTAVTELTACTSTSRGPSAGSRR
jgi:uncharacterized protein (DUF885 family)